MASNHPHWDEAFLPAVHFFVVVTQYVDACSCAEPSDLLRKD